MLSNLGEKEDSKDKEEEMDYTTPRHSCLRYFHEFKNR